MTKPVVWMNWQGLELSPVGMMQAAHTLKRRERIDCYQHPPLQRRPRQGR